MDPMATETEAAATVLDHAILVYLRGYGLEAFFPVLKRQEHWRLGADIQAFPSRVALTVAWNVYFHETTQEIPLSFHSLLSHGSAFVERAGALLRARAEGTDAAMQVWILADAARMPSGEPLVTDPGPEARWASDLFRELCSRAVVVPADERLFIEQALLSLEALNTPSHLLEHERGREALYALRRHGLPDDCAPGAVVRWVDQGLRLWAVVLEEIDTTPLLASVAAPDRVRAGHYAQVYCMLRRPERFFTVARVVPWALLTPTQRQEARALDMSALLRQHYSSHADACAFLKRLEDE